MTVVHATVPVILEAPDVRRHDLDAVGHTFTFRPGVPVKAHDHVRYDGAAYVVLHVKHVTIHGSYVVFAVAHDG